MKLRAGVVGLRMGMQHVRSLYELDEFNLVALCDLNTELAKEVASEYKVAEVYADYDEMLEKANLDVVAIATPNNFHAPMTIKAANAGVKGIYCEKPMALNLKEAREMKEACDYKGIPLIIGHQRRTTPPYTTMKRLIDDGEIGEVYLVRGLCPGDCLSDGTHTVDSVLYLLGDVKPSSVIAQIHRDTSLADGTGKTGFRYGHPVESGSMAIIELENNVRFELFTGDLRLMTWDSPYPGWAYQDIEILGTKGRIWRNGDQAKPEVRIWNNETQGWKAAKLDPDQEKNSFNKVFKDFYKTITEGVPHIMSADKAIFTQEIIMGIYESARTRSRLAFPIEQEEFPLALMLNE